MREMKQSEEAALVKELWHTLMSNVQIDDAMNEFLKSRIDDCGTEICFSAFAFVTNVLDPAGFVRRIHKNEQQNLKEVLKNPEGPWIERDKAIHWKADFMGSWSSTKGQGHLSEFMFKNFSKAKRKKGKKQDVSVNDEIEGDGKDDENERENNTIDELESDFPKYVNTKENEAGNAKVKIYYPLTEKIANKFCTKDKDAIALDRNEIALIGADDRPTICQEPDTEIFVQNVREGNKVKYKLARKSVPTEDGQSSVIRRWEKVFTLKEALTMIATFDNSGGKKISQDMEQRLKDQTVPLEPWWIFDLHHLQKPNDKIKNADKLHYTTAFMGSKPDLTIEIGFNNIHSGKTKKCVIISETDGSDKTMASKPKEENEKKSKQEDENENTDPIKLTVKMMQACSVQQALQEETYNIRSNFYTYFEQKIEESLFDTTNIHLPSYQEILQRKEVNSTGKLEQNNSYDYKMLSHATSLMHQMYIAHVKVAFIILLKEKYNINLLNMDKGLDRGLEKTAKLENQMKMCDHHFFINFDGFRIPNTLTFQHKSSVQRIQWLSDHRMLQSRSKCKIWNSSQEKEEYISAPIMNASSTHSMMQNWKANVDIIRLDDMAGLTDSKFNTAVPVVCTTIQRVNMKKLCDIIITAANLAHASYHEARIVKPRVTSMNVGSKTETLKRRLLPDRCFLTRKQQMDPDAHWNKQICAKEDIWQSYVKSRSAPYIAEEYEVGDARGPCVGLRRLAEDSNDDLIEHFLGYENPYLKRKPFHVPDINAWSPEDIDNCKWDQIDVRKYFFHMHMINQHWEQYADGVWYHDDYMQFLDTLRNLNVGKNRFNGSNCHFTCFTDNFHPNERVQEWNKKDDSKQINLRKQCAALSKYTFRIHKTVGNFEDDSDCQYNFYASMFQHNPEVLDDQDGKATSMPVESYQQDKAHHLFSILSWFFDCRDGGACRFEWEDALCDYFGANIIEQFEN